MNTMLVLYLAGGLIASQPSTPAECRLALATAAHVQEQQPAAVFMFEHDGQLLAVLRMECDDGAGGITGAGS